MLVCVCVCVRALNKVQCDPRHQCEAGMLAKRIDLFNWMIDDE